MKIRPLKGLTFDDVLLVPKRSALTSRQEADTSSWLTPTIPLRIPIISANMDTVTEAKMAIAMARAGGIGFIHRFMSVPEQARQVERVKRAEGFVVEHPYSIAQNASILKARHLMKLHDVGGLVVTDTQGELVGLVTQRDVLLAPDHHASVSSVMTGHGQIVSAVQGISFEEAKQLLHEHRLEKLPIIDRDNRLVGLITTQDLVKHYRYPNATKDEKGRLRVGAAIGVQSDDLKRAEALLKAEVDLLVVDIAHGHADHCLHVLQELRRNFGAVPLIAGNVATQEGARDLAEAGADAIKVGVGPGAVCSTRIVAGFGVPQLTAIMDCVEGVAETGRNVPVIADGGIRMSGDIVKALAAGAATVMIGSLFAGCEETPGATVLRDGQKVKVVRGMASLGAAMGRRIIEGNSGEESAESQQDWNKVVPEGVEAVVPYRGEVGELLEQLVGGLRSGISYGGGRTIAELQAKAEFIEITPAGLRESHSHDVERV